MEPIIKRWIFVLLAWIILGWSSLGYCGTTPGVSVANLIKISASPLSTNKKTGTSIINVTLTHRLRPKQPVYAPLTLIITSMSLPNVTLANASGFTPDNQPFLTVQLPKGQLNAGKAIKKIALKFNNPTRKKFKVNYAIYGLLAPNKQPKAQTNTDLTAFVGEELILDGSASSDPDANPLSYLWTLTEKPSTSVSPLLAPDTPSPRLTIDAPGTYRLQLIVNDGITDSIPASITIQASNHILVPGPVNLGEL